MTKPSPGTRQVNLMLTATQEKLVRQMVQRLREGGVEYEQRVRLFVSEAPVPRYMHVDELDRRFGGIDRRFETLERQLRELMAEPESEQPPAEE